MTARPSTWSSASRADDPSTAASRSRRPTRRSRSQLNRALLYAASARHVFPRGGAVRKRLQRFDDRLVFVIGSPRSGTTFLGATIGALPGFVDLGEVQPLKASMPELFGLDEEEEARRIRRILQTQRLLALVPGMRGVEQGPETGFVFPAALRAYPQGRAIHLLRDGRDVVCSLLERGWLRAGQERWRDQVAEGHQARFWVEPERREEFEAASEATRAAWVWRRYVTAARRPHQRKVEIRYEEMTAAPEAVAAVLAEHIDVPWGELVSQLGDAHDRSIGRWRRDLTPEQISDVEKEAGQLLAKTGYA